MTIGTRHKYVREARMPNVMSDSRDIQSEDIQVIRAID